MQRITSNGTAIPGSFYWLRVIGYTGSTTPTISMDGVSYSVGEILENFVAPSDRPWQNILATSGLTIDLGEAGDPVPPGESMSYPTDTTGRLVTVPTVGWAAGVGRQSLAPGVTDGTTIQSVSFVTDQIVGLRVTVTSTATEAGGYTLSIAGVAWYYRSLASADVPDIVIPSLTVTAGTTLDLKYSGTTTTGTLYSAVWSQQVG